MLSLLVLLGVRVGVLELLLYEGASPEEAAAMAAPMGLQRRLLYSE